MARTIKSLAAEAAFSARLAELGATLLEPAWLGAFRPHRVRCVAGHLCTPRPAGVAQGKGICRACAGNDPAAAEAAFRARLAELGATLLEPYHGVDHPHRVRCLAEHLCTPRPLDVAGVKRQGICRACAGNDPAAAEAAFRARLAELGATLLEPWRGSQQAHRVRCAEGHDCLPRPAHVAAGHGICLPCRGRLWDSFYVVANDATRRIKFGVTTGNGRLRLSQHRRAGYGRVILLQTALPSGVAHELELSVRAALKLAGELPAAGREYFDVSALAVVLDIAAVQIGGVA